MAKNRNRNKPMGWLPKLVIGACALGTAGGVVYLSVDGKSNDLDREINDLKREYANEDNIYIHEDKLWKEMSENPEKLDFAIKQKGMAMGLPTPEQIIRIDAEGVPLPGQPSMKHYQKLISEYMVGR